MDFNTNKKTTNEDVGFFSVENPSIIEPIASICSGRPNDALAPPHVDGGGSGGGPGGGYYTGWEDYINEEKRKSKQ